MKKEDYRNFGATALVEKAVKEGIEREALELFLESVNKELNTTFSIFYSSVDYSGRLPQLAIREDGEI